MCCVTVRSYQVKDFSSSQKLLVTLGLMTDRVRVVLSSD